MSKSNKSPVRDPVNSEQLEMQESAATLDSEAPLAAAPTLGELEERAIEAENRAAAAESRFLGLQEEMHLLRELVAAHTRASTAVHPAGASSKPLPSLDGAIPIFDDEAPYGTVVGDVQAAYVQNGHQFGRDKQYIATEPYRGSPRAFNPKLVGFVKPRAGQRFIDPLDGVPGRE